MNPSVFDQERSSSFSYALWWVNLRHSQATNLADEIRSHASAECLGQCERLADEHYHQATCGQFAKAIRTNIEYVALPLALQSEAELGGIKSPASLSRHTSQVRIEAEPIKKAVSSRSSKPLKWTILDSNQ